MLRGDTDSCDSAGTDLRQVHGGVPADSTDRLIPRKCPRRCDRNSGRRGTRLRRIVRRRWRHNPIAAIVQAMDIRCRWLQI